MRLIAKCKDNFINLQVDAVEVKDEDVLYAYKKPTGGLAATDFVGMFDFGSMDYIYVSEGKA